MKKEFIPYEQALALKEIGFDEPCLANYSPKFNLYHPEKNYLFNLKSTMLGNNECKAPTFSQAFRWFREKFKAEGYINLNDSKENNFHYYFNYINTNNIHNRREYCDFFIGNFKTYEEAELECLKKLIEIVTNKN